MDIASITIEIIAIIIAVKVFITRSRALKLLYICNLNFCIAGLIALYIKSPMGALVAMAYFVFSTISSNAIAHSIGEIKKIK
ncbi:DUF2109 domain-containing protein [Methanococcus aeolicus]|jgi:energy-converting hydrogenase A subunit C|uniref:Energy-converting hydrogenase A, subunit C n=1 Tax=Methanococcus aeolicus (strain ATCC BAA-1280 / DSM 17508 / OCM 812 / Nankai-3) TaxID=419665 RepID=A6UTX4_META3|nr:DUF2109 domain-containing protein [Methanococcus aeolicus]ABR55946.1 conserved hypothetical protein [Methanococcus aeolicus Nankai-3]UXM85455.1 DUF2109 domain-containing protein [Methanococcus aeolicus]